MSENLKYQLQQMTNEELIDFALEHLGQEHSEGSSAGTLSEGYRLGCGCEVVGGAIALARTTITLKTSKLLVFH